MCGICGAISYPLNNVEINHVQSLMVLSTLRGFEGSGAITVASNRGKLNVNTVKTELSCAELAVDPDFDAILKSPKIIIAHARAPTKGGNEKEFIHPHRVKHITGVHNGTMFEVMGEKIGNDESDSLKVFQALADHSIEDFIKGSRGAYSLVWIDTKNGTLNFLRNDQRPMIWARVGGDHASCMFWASERSMLEYTLITRGNYLASAIKYIMPKPWEHVSFALDVKTGIFPKEVKQYENPTSIPAYTKFHGGKWYSKSEWEKHLERQANAADKTETKGESAIPLLSPPRNSPPYQHSTTTSRTSSTRMRVGTGTDTRNGPYDPRTLPKVEDILGGGKRDVMFQIAGGKMAETLVSRGACVICDEKPRILSCIEDGEEKLAAFPKIHPIRFGNTGFMQYICEDCIETKNPIALSVLGAAAHTSSTKH